MSNSVRAVLFGALIIVTTQTFASGDPMVLYLFGAEVLALICVAFYIGLCNRPAKQRLEAAGLLMLGAVILLLLSNIEHGQSSQFWIDAGSLIGVAVGVVGAVARLRQS